MTNPHKTPDGGVMSLAQWSAWFRSKPRHKCGIMDADDGYVLADAIDAHLTRSHQALFIGTLEGKPVSLHGTKESVEALEQHLTRSREVSDEDVDRAASHAFQAYYRGSAYEGMSWLQVHPSDHERWFRATRACLTTLSMVFKVPDDLPDLWDTVKDTYAGDTSAIEKANWNDGWNACRAEMLKRMECES